MAFRTKDFLSIVAGAVNWARGVSDKITDYRIGSVARTLIEAPAIEVDELYQNMLRGLVEGIPAAIYQGFGFERLPAAAATGIVTFSIEAAIGTDTTIPAGTVVGTTDQEVTYETLAEAVIEAGQTEVNGSVAATQAGTVGNVPAGAISVMVTGPDGVDVTNAAAFRSGRDEETDDERALRFLEFVRNLSRGPLASIEFGLTLASVVNEEGVVVERVVAARAVELYELDPINALGYVDAFVWNGGTGASAELLAEAARIVDGYFDDEGERVMGYKAAGVVVRYQPVTLQTIALDMIVRTRDGTLTTSQEAAVTEQLSAYIDSTPIGGTVFNAGLNAAGLRVRGIVDARRSDSTDDIELGYAVKAVPGAIAITVLAADE